MGARSTEMISLGIWLRKEEETELMRLVFMRSRMAT